MLLSELARRMASETWVAPEDRAVTGFATDHRMVKPGQAFIAIRGVRVDGHDFCADAIANGATVCIVERGVPQPHIFVPNVAEGLASMGRSFRSQFSGPVVGVTGSVGKTTAKEMIAAALAPLGPVLKSEGNRNTEWTSPLIWAELEPSHQSVVVEMSMRGFGQIAHLAAVHHPTVGLITRIGSSHLELVGSLDGVARAKRELFEALPETGTAVVNRDDPYADYLVQGAKCASVTYGQTGGSDVRLLSFAPTSWHQSRMTIETTELGEAQVLESEMPFAGRHFAMNACAAVAVARACGVHVEHALHAIAKMPPVGGRMDVLQWRGVTIVYDAYNASPDSFDAALETLAAVPNSGRRIVIAGEMKELGAASVAEHRKIAHRLADSGVDIAVFLGDAMEEACETLKTAGWPEDRAWMARDHQAIRDFLATLVPGDCVLVKGSRAMELDRAMPEEFSS